MTPLSVNRIAYLFQLASAPAYTIRGGNGVVRTLAVALVQRARDREERALHRAFDSTLRGEEGSITSYICVYACWDVCAIRDTHVRANISAR